MFRTIMVTLAGVVITLGLTMLATMAGAGMAHADEYSFLADMEAAGFANNEGNQSELSVGYSVCSMLGSGMTGVQVARDLWTKSHMTQDESAHFVIISVTDLCPQYYHPHT
jgi:Protein of unknown function (DUF732)